MPLLVSYKGSKLAGANDSPTLEDPLRLLLFATHALLNSHNRQHEPACLPDTRVDLLQEIYD